MPPVLQQEEGIGVKGAGVDLPITLMDRPSIALANLMRADPGAAIRSVFSPDTLSPAESRRIYQHYMEGRPNPVLKAILDAATDPIVIIGLIMGMRWKTASPDALYKMGRDARVASKDIAGPMTRWFHSARTIFRNVAGLTDKLDDVEITTTKIASDYIEKMQKAVRTYVAKTGRKIEPLDQALLHAYTAEMHLADGPVSARLFGQGFRRPLADLSRMRPELKELGDSMRGIYDQYREMMRGNKRIMRILENSGAVLLEHGYAPQILSSSKFQLRTIRSMTEAEMRAARSGSTKVISNQMKARRFLSIPASADMELLRDNGYMKQEDVDLFETMARRAVGRLRAELQGWVKDWRSVLEMSSGTIDDESITAFKQARVDLAKRTMKYFKRPGDKKRYVRTIMDDLRTGVLEGPQQLEAAIENIAEGVGSLPRYSMMGIDNMDHYVKYFAPVWAWHGTGIGAQIDRIAESDMLSPWQKSFLKDHLQPAMLGQKSFNAMQRAAAFTHYRMKIGEFIETSEAAQKYLPKNIRDWMMSKMTERGGRISDIGAGGAIANWMYLSSLGGNIGATSKNLMQNFLGPYQLLGAKAMGRGLKRVVDGIPTYISTAMEKGDEAGMRAAYGDFIDTLGYKASSSAHMLKGGTLYSFESAKAQGIASKLGEALMTPFMGSERFNRLLTYYGSKASAKIIGTEKFGGAGDVERFAREMVERFQFTSGPLGTPSAFLTSKWLSWAPLRQFQHFPLRYMSMLHEGMYSGADPTKVSFGLLGKMMATTGLLYHGAKNLLGTDVSQGLMLGALPSPSYEGAPFYPWPLVPPVVSAGGAMASALASGDFSKVSTTAWMMAPGGIAARRAYRALSPSYADYKNIDEQGRIPLYNRDNMLIGQVTPWQLTKKAMGWQDMDVQGEQQMISWLLKQRDQIRAYRREYIERVLSNRMEDAQQLDQEFQKRYKMGPLQVRKSDIKTAQDRRQISRANRVIAGIPKEYRPAFEEVLANTTFASMMENLPKEPLSPQALFDQGL